MYVIHADAQQSVLEMQLDSVLKSPRLSPRFHLSAGKHSDLHLLPLPRADCKEQNARMRAGGLCHEEK